MCSLMCPSFWGFGLSLQGLQEKRASARLFPSAAPSSSAQRDEGRGLGVRSGIIWVHLKHSHSLLFFREAYSSLMENVESIEKLKEVILPLSEITTGKGFGLFCLNCFSVKKCNFVFCLPPPQHFS